MKECLCSAHDYRVRFTCTFYVLRFTCTCTYVHVHVHFTFYTDILVLNCSCYITFHNFTFIIIFKYARIHIYIYYKHQAFFTSYAWIVVFAYTSPCTVIFGHHASALFFWSCSAPWKGSSDCFLPQPSCVLAELLSFFCELQLSMVTEAEVRA